MHRLRKALDTVRGYWRYFVVRSRCIAGSKRQCAVSERRLAILAWEFPPSIAGGVYRPAALVRYARQYGFDVSVVAGPKPAELSMAGVRLLDYVGSGVCISRMNCSSISPSFSLFPQIDGGFVSALDMFCCARQALSARPPYVIVATGPPFSDFVAGFFLASHFGSKLVLDYRDEWTRCPFDFVAKGKANAIWEERCLKQAKLVVFTTEAQRKLLIEEYGDILEKKSIVIPNGWEPAAASKRDTPALSVDRRAVLLFAGKLGGHTDPKQFLSTLEKLIDERPQLKSQFVVRFLGLKNSDAAIALASFRFPEVIESLDLVPLDEAVSLMHDADALLLFHDPRFERYLPGKLYEYLASGTRILLLGDSGESRRLLAALDAGWAIDSDDPQELGAVLDNILYSRCLDKPREESCRTVRQEWLARHSRERVIGSYLKSIDCLWE